MLLCDLCLTQGPSVRPIFSAPHVASILRLQNLTVMHSLLDALELGLLPEPAWVPSSVVVPLCPKSQAPERSAGGVQVPVLHVINGEHYAGAERVQDLLATRLQDFGYSVGFATLKSGQFSSQRQSQGSSLHALSMRSQFDLRPALALARLVRAHGYRLIHTHTPRAALVGRLAAALSGIPLVHHLHSPTVNDSTHRVRNHLNAAVERWGFRRAAMVIAVSDSLADYGERQGIQRKRLRVIPNGVPTPSTLVNRPMTAKSCTLGCVALFRAAQGSGTAAGRAGSTAQPRTRCDATGGGLV